MSASNILVVEDDPVATGVLHSRLTALGYEVITVASGGEALQVAASRRPDLMILDLTLDGEPSDSMRDGFALLGWLRFKFPDAKFPVIIHTLDDSERVKARAAAEGVYAVFSKGHDLSGLLDAVQKALKDFCAPSSA